MSVFLNYLRVLQLSFTDWAHFNKNTKNNKPVWNFQIFCFVVRILFRKSVNNTGKGDFNSFIEKNELIYSLLSTEWPLQCREGKLLRLKTSDLWRFVSKSGKLYWYCFNHHPPQNAFSAWPSQNYFTLQRNSIDVMAHEQLCWC